MKMYNVLCLFYVMCLVKTGFTQDIHLLRQWIYGKFNAADDTDRNRSPNIEIDNNRNTYYNLRSHEMGNPVSLQEFNSLFIPFYHQKFNSLKNNLYYQNYKDQVTPYPKYNKIKIVSNNLVGQRRKAEKYLLENFVYKSDTTTKTWESFRREGIADKLYVGNSKLFSTIPVQGPMGYTIIPKILNVSKNYGDILKKAPNAFNDDVYFSEPSNVVNTLVDSNDEGEGFTKMSEIIENVKKISISPEEYILSNDSNNGTAKQLKSGVDKDSLFDKLNYENNSNMVTRTENTRTEKYINPEKSFERFYVPTKMNDEKTTIKYSFSENFDLSDHLVEYDTKNNVDKSYSEIDNTSFKNESKSVLEENAISHTDLRNDIINEKSYENQDFRTSDIKTETSEENFTPIIKKLFPNLTQKAFNKLNTSDHHSTSLKESDKIFSDVSELTTGSNFDPIQSTETMYKSNSEKNQFEDTASSIVVFGPIESSTESTDDQTQLPNNEFEQGKNIELTLKYKESSENSFIARPTQVGNFVNNIYETDFGSTTNPTETRPIAFTTPYSLLYSSESDNVISKTTTYRPLYLSKASSNNNENEDTMGNEKFFSYTTDITTSNMKVENLFVKDNELEMITNNPPNFDVNKALPKEITNIQETTELFGDIVRNLDTTNDSVDKNIHDIPTGVTENFKDNVDTLKSTYKNDETDLADSFTERLQNSQKTTTEYIEILQNKNISLENVHSESEMKSILSSLIAEKNERLDNVERSESITNFNSNVDVVNEAIYVTTGKINEDDFFATERNYISTPVVKQINLLSNTEKLLRENEFYENNENVELTDNDNENNATFTHEISYYTEKSYDWTTGRSLLNNYNFDYFIEDPQSTGEASTVFNADQQNEYTNLEYVQSATEMKSLLSTNIVEVMGKTFDDVLEDNASTNVNNENGTTFGKVFDEEEALYETTTESTYDETINISLPKHNIDSSIDLQSIQEITTEFVVHQHNENTTLEYVLSATEMERLLSPLIVETVKETQNFDDSIENSGSFDEKSSFIEFNTDLENDTHTVEITTENIRENESSVSEINFKNLLTTLNMEISVTESNSLSNEVQLETETDQFYKIDEEQGLTDGNIEDNVTSDDERAYGTTPYYAEHSYDSMTSKSLLNQRNTQETTTNFIDDQQNENLPGYVHLATETKSILSQQIAVIVNKSNEIEDDKLEKEKGSSDDKQLNSDFKDETYTTIETTTIKINETESSTSEKNAIETTPSDSLSNYEQLYRENKLFYDTNNKQEFTDEYEENISNLEERSHTTLYETTTMSLSPNQQTSTIVNVFTNYNSQKASTDSNNEYSTIVLGETFIRTEKSDTFNKIKSNSNENLQIYIHNTIDSLKSITASLLTNQSNNNMISSENVTNTNEINKTVVQNEMVSPLTKVSNDLDNDRRATEEISVSENRMSKKIDLEKHKINLISNDVKKDREIESRNHIFHRRSDIIPEEDSDYSDK